jgi:hypothetical protein
MENPSNVHAVLTGDIVGSSRLSSEERRVLHARFADCAVKLDHAFGGKILHLPEIVRGDSWQFAVAEPERALRIALFFRALIRISLPGEKTDSRIAIGLGTIDFIPGAEISSGDGEAYRLSGEGLEAMQKTFRMGLFLPARYTSLLSTSLDVIVKLLDREVRKWTEAQAESVAGALLGLTQQAIASDWVQREISQQAVAQNLERAGWSTIETGLAFYERSLPGVLSNEQEQV